MPDQLRRVTLVTGPPCAGKSTYVARHAHPDDVILCVDTFARDAGSTSVHGGHAGRHWQAAERRFRRGCAELAAQVDASAWVIRGVPEPRARAQLAAHIGATRVVVLLPTLDVAYTRALARGDDPAVDVVATCRAITSWFRRYRPSPTDETIAVATDLNQQANS